MCAYRKTLQKVLYKEEEFQISLLSVCAWQVCKLDKKYNFGRYKTYTCGIPENRNMFEPTHGKTYLSQSEH